MKFLEPEMFWHLIWILPCMFAVFVTAWYRRKKVIKTLTGQDSPDGIMVVSSPGMRIFRFVLLNLAVIFLITALARPAWDYETIDMTSSGRDLIVVFDTSKSMLSKDVQPCRLDHAKWFVKELVKLNPQDRFGLIAFAGSAFMECPLTIDKTSFLQYISELDTQTIPVGGTNIERALETALNAFSAAEAVHRAIILITDGDELTGNSKDILKQLSKKKIPIFIVGVGDPSQPSIIQYKDEKGVERILKDSAGNVVNSPLNEKQLIELAQQTGGIYVRSTAADTGLLAIEKRIRQLDAAEFSTISSQKPIERFAYPLWAAFIILIIWMCISERGKKKKIILLLFLAALSIPLRGQAIQKNTSETEKLTAVQLYNRACELQSGKVKIEKQDPIKIAEEYYLKALAAGTDKQLSGNIYQNLGVIRHSEGLEIEKKAMQDLQQQKPQEAIKKLDSVLEKLSAAEKFYQESMAYGNNIRNVALNQTKLIKMRKSAEALKKKIEEMLKQQQKAQQQAQQAQNQQKKENQQQQNQQQKKENQQQQNQQQQQQNQQQQKNQSAEDMTSQAKQSAEKLENMSKELGQKQREQQAGAAKKELEKAEKAQKNNQPEKAENHLKKASELLGEKKNQKQNGQDKQKKDGKENQQKKEKQSGNGKQDKKMPQQPQSAQQNEMPQEGEIDKNQAESILGQMGDEEKDLRNRIKVHSRNNMRIPPVTKDW